MSTGLSLTEIIDALNDIGLRGKDLVRLELLNNEAIVQVMDTSNPCHRSDEDVVEYLRTWADLLEEAQPLADEAGETAVETAERTEADLIPA